MLLARASTGTLVAGEIRATTRAQPRAQVMSFQEAAMKRYHPVIQILGAPSEATDYVSEVYSPSTQLPLSWAGLREYDAMIAAAGGTGKPDTRSNTTAVVHGSDDDTDDSGT